MEVVAISWKNFRIYHFKPNLFRNIFFWRITIAKSKFSEIPYGRTLFGRRTLWGELFFCEEHFEQSTIGAQITLRRTLLDRRAVKGDHQMNREFFLKALFLGIALCGEHSFFLQMFLKGRELYATMDRGTTYLLISLDALE